MATDLNLLLKKVKKLQLQLNQKVNSYLVGTYHSTFKGRGLEFDEVRPFQEGDDVKNIDWNVTARQGFPHIKVFEEERGLTIYLAVDLSASMLFHNKRSCCLEIASLIAASAIENGDNVGLFIFTDQIELILPAKRNKEHLLRIIRELDSFIPKSKKSDLKTILKKLYPFQNSSTATFLISDFFSGEFQEALKVTAAKGSLLAIQIEDPLETELPSNALLELEDMETGDKLLVDPTDPLTREHLKKVMTEHEEDVKRLMSSSKIASILLKTNEDPLIAFKKLLLLQRKTL